MPEFEYRPHHARTVADRLKLNFDWNRTQQGPKFWEPVHKAFEALAGQDEEEFEDNIKLAISSYTPDPEINSEVVRDESLAIALDRAFIWRHTSYEDFFRHIHRAFRVPSCFDTCIKEAVQS